MCSDLCSCRLQSRNDDQEWSLAHAARVGFACQAENSHRNTLRNSLKTAAHPTILGALALIVYPHYSIPRILARMAEIIMILDQRCLVYFCRPRTTCRAGLEC